jgi:hypothetical protein
LVLGSLVTLWTGSCTGLWSVLARQSPSSPYRLAGFFEPIEALSLRLFIIAAITLACTPLAERGGLFARAARAWATVTLWTLGVALSCAAMAYAGATGALGVQLLDSGQRGHETLVVRWLGDAMLLASLALSQSAIASAARRAERDAA